MPEILTFSDLSSFSAKALRESTTITKSMDVRDALFTADASSVFVSYSSKDAQYLPGVVMLLKNSGGSPYVDVGDDRLPKQPSADTARLLKDAIVRCRRLVVFVTTHSMESKWVPWELGLADGAKSSSDIALIPAADRSDESQWTEHEYFGLYQRIVWGHLQGHEKEVWMVFNHVKNSALLLSEWLRG